MSDRERRLKAVERIAAMNLPVPDRETMSSRDTVHAAVALNNQIARFISTDRDFDVIKEVKRVDPVYLG